MRGPTEYDAIATRYAAGVDERPWNALYERPATLALLPELAGLDVLDAGCGHGWYAEYFLDHGARVTGIDRSERMVDIARQRLGKRARLIHGDMSDLQLLGDASFDLIVSPLVIHYIENLRQMFAEWARVLRPNRTIVFSTHNPARTATVVERGTLFPTLVEEAWPWLNQKMRYYQRSLRDITEPLTKAGFAIERIDEPTPSEALRQKDPKGFERLTKLPAFIFVRAHKP
ncbi:MAG: methyltransferase domain-containing protein [Kofleriaceae bacterium]